MSVETVEKAAAPSLLRGRLSTWGMGALSLLLGIGLWWLATLSDATPLPGPFEVVERFGKSIASGQWFADLRASITRVFTGFVLGSLAAIPIGFLMGWYRIARGLIDPWIQFFRVIPPLAIIPLAIVTMGIGETPKIFVIFLAAFLQSVIASYQGVLNVDKTYINAARVLGANDWVIFTRVVVPASTPFIFVGLRIGLGASWATVVAAELIAAQLGLGFRMQQGQLYYDLPVIFVSLITIGAVGLTMDRAVVWAEQRFTSWQERV